MQEYFTYTGGLDVDIQLFFFSLVLNEWTLILNQTTLPYMLKWSYMPQFLDIYSIVYCNVECLPSDVRLISTKFRFLILAYL